MPHRLVLRACHLACLQVRGAWKGHVVAPLDSVRAELFNTYRRCARRCLLLSSNAVMRARGTLDSVRAELFDTYRRCTGLRLLVPVSQSGPLHCCIRRCILNLNPIAPRTPTAASACLNPIALQLLCPAGVPPLCPCTTMRWIRALFLSIIC